MHGRPPRPRAGMPTVPFPRFPRFRASLSRELGGYPVAEEPKPNPENQGPKDERDLIIEDLKKRMEKIESDYQIKIGDYQKANAELWARLHPAAQEPAPPAQPEPVKDPYEVMLDSFDSALGIKKKKE